MNEHQFWRHDNKPIELWSNAVIWEKISYVHNNLVAAGLVSTALNLTLGFDFDLFVIGREFLVIRVFDPIAIGCAQPDIGTWF